MIISFHFTSFFNLTAFLSLNIFNVLHYSHIFCCKIYIYENIFLESSNVSSRKKNIFFLYFSPFSNVKNYILFISAVCDQLPETCFCIYLSCGDAIHNNWVFSDRIWRRSPITYCRVGSSCVLCN